MNLSKWLSSISKKWSQFSNTITFCLDFRIWNICSRLLTSNSFWSEYQTEFGVVHVRMLSSRVLSNCHLRWLT